MTKKKEEAPGYVSVNKTKFRHSDTPIQVIILVGYYRYCVVPISGYNGNDTYYVRLPNGISCVYRADQLQEYIENKPQKKSWQFWK